jgi:sugar lactone lactonase YvrE
MLALYRSGRQSDALAVYRSGHRAMAAVGIEPSRELRALERAILEHDDSVGAPAVPVRARRRPRWAVAAGGAVVAVAAVVGAVLLQGGGSAEPGVPPDAPRSGALEFDAGRAQFERAITFPSTATGAAPGFGAWWIATGTGVAKLSLRSGRPIGSPTQIAGGAQSVVVADDFVWAANQDSLRPRAVKIDPAGNTVGTIVVPTFSQLFEGAGFLWLTGGRHLTRIDPTGQGHRVRIAVDPTQNGNNPLVMAFGGGHGWVMAANAREPGGHQPPGVLYEIDPARARIAHEIAIPNTVGAQDAFEVAYGAGAVWVADRNTGRLWRVDPGTLSRSVVAHLGFIDAVAVGAGSVWAITDHKTLSGAHPALVKLTTDGKVLSRRALPGNPQNVSVQGRLVAVTYGGP